MLRKPRFFFEEFDSASTDAPPESVSTLSGFEPAPDGAPARAAELDRVEGEKPPDFAFLKSGKEPAKPKTEEKTAEKPEKPQEKAPEAKKEASKPEAAKPEHEAREEKRDEPKKEAKIPETDDDIDALRPKPGVSAGIVKNFSDMKAMIRSERVIARAAMADLAGARKEIESLKSSTGKLPPEIESELDGLRKLSLLMNAEKDPRFVAEYDTKTKAADDKIIGFLEKRGLSAAVIAEIKASASAAKGDMDAWPRWPELIKAFENPLDQQELMNSIKERRDVLGAKAQRLSEITASREKYHEEIGRRESGDRDGFAKSVEKHSIQLAAAHDWILEQDVPANATEEQKKIIGERNSEVSKRAAQFSDHVRDVYSRNPEKSAEVALKAVEADYLRGQLEKKSTEYERSSARVKVLEDQLAKIKSAGRIAHMDGAAPEKATVERPAAGIGGDGHDAIRSFQWKK